MDANGRKIGDVTCELTALTFGTPDPQGLARFWGGLLGQAVTTDRGAPALTPHPEVGFGIRFVVTSDEKWGPNQMHPDLKPTSLDEQAAAVDRALGLGARHLDVGQGDDAEHVVLADPDGNELCVLEPGGTFLAGCPFFSSLAATVWRGSAISGATSSNGTWSGTRMVRLPSSHPSAAPS